MISKIKRIQVLSIIFLICNTSYSQIQTGYDSIDVFIKKRMEQYHIPGIAACVVKGGKIEWSNAYGLANIANKIPFTTDAIMNVASISKTITATAIMKLWEKGKIKLDEDINAYLPISIRNPNFPDIPITIQQLLTHTSSINDGSAYDNCNSCGDSKISLKYWVTNYLIKEGEFYNETENFYPNDPGTIHRYSNVGYGLLGYIVEEVARVPFNIYCKENIFKPLEMDNTGWHIQEIDSTNHVVPYMYMTKDLSEDKREAIVNVYNDLFPGEKEFPLNKHLAACIFSSPNYPDGGLRTSVKELSYFLLAFINGGTYNGLRILKESTVNKMLTLQIEGNNSQGLCWHKDGFESLWGHGGGDPGIRTKMYFSPETKIGIITFQNSFMGDPFEIVKMLYLSAKQ